MLLTEKQKDSIAEVINISFSRAAKSLNELTGSRVIISVPKIELYMIDELEEALNENIKDEITTVHQIFKGAVEGDALLIFDRESSKKLVNIILKENQYFDELSEYQKEVIIEIGNILLSSFLSALGNLFNVQFKFSVPRITLYALSKMIKTFEFEDSEIRYALIIFMEFSVEDRDIKGMLITMMGITSIEKFLAEIDKLG